MGTREEKLYFDVRVEILVLLSAFFENFRRTAPVIFKCKYPSPPGVHNSSPVSFELQNQQVTDVQRFTFITSIYYFPPSFTILKEVSQLLLVL